jgi:hypothetical protein
LSGRPISGLILAVQTGHDSMAAAAALVGDGNRRRDGEFEEGLNAEFALRIAFLVGWAMLRLSNRNDHLADRTTKEPVLFELCGLSRRHLSRHKSDNQGAEWVSLAWERS